MSGWINPAEMQRVADERMEALLATSPEALTQSMAEEALGELRLRCRARHETQARRGAMAGRAFCACGHPSVGDGGELCGALDRLAEGGDEAPWLQLAIGLYDALKGAP